MAVIERYALLTDSNPNTRRIDTYEPIDKTTIHGFEITDSNF